jgi:hypothetical protein
VLLVGDALSLRDFVQLSIIGAFVLLSPVRGLGSAGLGIRISISLIT